MNEVLNLSVCPPCVCLSQILDELKIKLLYCKNLPLREGALLSIVTRFPTSCVNFLPLILWCVTQHHLFNQILVFLKIYPPELPNCTHIDYLHVLRVRMQYSRLQVCLQVPGSSHYYVSSFYIDYANSCIRWLYAVDVFY